MMRTLPLAEREGVRDAPVSDLPQTATAYDSPTAALSSVMMAERAFWSAVPAGSQ